MIDRINSDSKIFKANSNKDIVYVSGLPRSGKSLFAPIISSFDESEHFKMDPIIEQFPILNHLGKISDEIAIYLLRYSIRLMIYNNYIGRNTNFRIEDETSIWKTNDPKGQFEKLFINDGITNYKEIKKNNSFFIIVLHNALLYIKILFKSHPSIKIIDVKANPIDIVFAWYDKKYGSDIYNKVNIDLLTIKYEKDILPFYALGWEKEYLELAPIDRIIKMIYTLEKEGANQKDNLSKINQGKILSVKYDELINKPNRLLNIICDFLSMNKTYHTEKILKSQEMVDRKLNLEKRKQKFDKIKNISSKNSLNLLNNMIEIYESDKNVK